MNHRLSNVGLPNTFLPGKIYWKNIEEREILTQSIEESFFHRAKSDRIDWQNVDRIDWEKPEAATVGVL